MKKNIHLLLRAGERGESSSDDSCRCCVLLFTATYISNKDTQKYILQLFLPVFLCSRRHKICHARAYRLY